MAILSFPQTETTLLFPGPSGALELIITPADTSSATSKVAIICHPHPLHGGTMDNKVVTMTAKTLHSLGFATIRFNYRGVGKSEGEFGNFVGETADLLSILDWVREVLPQASFCLAGFSFGSYIAAQGALQRSDYVKQLINIAPAVNHADFTVFSAVKCPWLIIQGTEDEIVPASEVRDFIKLLPLSTRIKLVEIPDATHFFHGKLLELRDIIVENIEFR
jgi:uncharacterized protein